MRSQINSSATAFIHQIQVLSLLVKGEQGRNKQVDKKEIFCLSKQEFVREKQHSTLEETLIKVAGIAYDLGVYKYLIEIVI